MERAKRPYAIYKRKPSKLNSPTTKSRRPHHKRQAVFYVRFRNPDTSEYLTAISSGCTNRDAAVRWADKQLESGAYLNHGAHSPTFDEAAEGFWDFETSPYILSRLARGKPFSRSYAAIRAGQVTHHLSPILGPRRLTAIRHSDIENMVMGWYKAGELSPASINRLLVTTSVMFKFWVSQGLLPSNPCAKIEPVEEKPKKRKILSVDEAKRFFALPFTDLRYKAVNMLAASTGLRLGECIGLLKGDLHEDTLTAPGGDGKPTARSYYRIDLQHQWQDIGGILPPKWGSSGEIPLPPTVGAMLKELVDLNPYANDFFFFGSTPDRPLSRKTVSLAYNKAINAIGISESERTARGLSFHAWRHFANAMMHGRLSGAQVRKVTRHRSEEMTERYDHLTGDDAAAVLGAQEAILAEITAPNREKDHP